MLHPWATSWGEEIAPSHLQLEAAVRFRDFVSKYGSELASIAGARRSAGAELVALRFQTGRPQRSVFKLLSEEPIGVVFAADGPPVVVALRTDFPDTPHQSMVPEDVPCCLCIDDRPWQEAKGTFTSAELLRRIANWFERAGLNQLHDLTQPLDPFFGGQLFDIVVPASAFAATDGEELHLIGLRPDTDSPRVLIAYPSTAFEAPPQKGRIVLVAYSLPAATMTRLRKAPTNLHSLAVALKERGLDIIPDLAGRIRRWALAQDKNFGLDARLGLLLRMPIVHPVTNEVAGSNVVAFLSQAELGEIGTILGQVSKNNSGDADNFRQIVNVVPRAPDDHALREIQIAMAATQIDFNGDRAAALAGRKDLDTRRLVLIGAGTIASIIAEFAVREGRFSWTVVDNDCLLPHNLARHTLTEREIGTQKAVSLANRINSIRYDACALSIVADVLQPGALGDSLQTAFAEADIILDCSASIAVARYTSDLAGTARRASVFFNPAGTAAVLMVEDQCRRADLRSIEALYYSAILRELTLAEHLSQAADRIPYSGSCRAVTNRIPASRAATLGGLLASGLCLALDRPSATLRIWSVRDDGSVSVISRTPHAPVIHRCGGWVVCIDTELEKTILSMRGEKLNDETGGVLLGIADIAAKRIDLIDAWPEPSDSVGSPTSFVRGTDGLKQAVLAAIGKTLDQVRYVGEWHSHPRRAVTSPSSTDILQLAWLAKTLGADGFPGLMIIAGDTGLSVSVGELTENSRNNGADAR